MPPFKIFTFYAPKYLNIHAALGLENIPNGVLS
jgi:hypothetical protein